MAELGVALGSRPRSARSSAASRSRPVPSRSTSPRASSIARLLSRALLLLARAGFDLGKLGDIFLPAALIAAAMLAVSPSCSSAFSFARGRPRALPEIGFRLGQLSEFSLLIAVLAATNGVIGARRPTDTTRHHADVPGVFLHRRLRFPTPIAVSDRLRRTEAGMARPPIQPST